MPRQITIAIDLPATMPASLLPHMLDVLAHAARVELGVACAAYLRTPEGRIPNDYRVTAEVR